MDKFNKKRIFDGFPIFFILVICFIYSTGQFTDTYIRHDDWEFMTHLLPNMNHHGTPWDKTLWEGRWINFLWSYQAKELSINANYIIFILGYSLFSWVYSSFLVKEYVYIKNDIFIKVIISLMIFFCPTYADLSLWPATLSPSVWIAFVGVLYCIYKEYWLGKVILFITLVMSYAPLAPACLLLIVSCQNQSFLNVFRTIILYISSYLLGVLIIYTLNYKFHGVFGVQIQDWRNPNPLVSFQTFIDNFHKSLGIWESIFYRNRYLLSFCVLATSFNIYLNRKNRNIINVWVGVLCVFIFEFLISLYSGVDLPDRAIIWLWMFFVIIVSNSLFFMLNFNYLGKLYYVIPLFFIFYGANSWNEFYTSESKFAKIENNLLNLLSLQPRKDVFICGDIGKLVGTGVTRDINAISLSFLKRQNIVLHSEEVAECNYVPNHLGVYDVNGITILKLN
ncbi:hypothetical protein ACQP31_07425 [Actinobacillus pleuropneumoniae]|uniref:hypothetical protein n=1 Tax=Actinobacillus pleuropneumoniae TaxID=715 RepID=UPI0001E49E2C|nr:hypothetical protein [Actinobacillus pleuropneumoniae]EFN00176.1 hypothetical protein appser12_14990 [Actinobacillus pleuropneumoniae serovar 12 str. 1096]UKH29192.1 hypothetical protein D1105_07555 [Actinobacillus pleuropneumoniae]